LPEIRTVDELRSIRQQRGEEGDFEDGNESGTRKERQRGGKANDLSTIREEAHEDMTFCQPDSAGGNENSAT